MKGSYSLIIKTPKKAEVGALGLKKFDKEYAVYNGSAFGPGGLKRVFRHFEFSGNPHWHIDYLLKSGYLEAAVIFPGKDLECRLSQKLNGDLVKDFGCSDCSCQSHFFEYNSFSEALTDLELFSDMKVIDRERYEEYRNSESQKSIKDLIEYLPDTESYKNTC